MKKLTKKIGVYPGSFDPFTNGHLSIVRNASKLFDEVIISIAQNPDKTRKIDASTMQTLIKKVIKDESINNVKVEISSDLTIRFTENNKANFIIRGLRSETDYQYEEAIARINKELRPGIETIYLRAEYEAVSSSMVMEFFKYGEDVSKFIPKAILSHLNAMR